jgi:hypothetical protein
MRTSAIVLLTSLVAVVVSCGGDSDDATPDGADDRFGFGSDGLDPCGLADEAILSDHFGDAAPIGEPTEAGPVTGCSWSDVNANSLLIQTAQDFALYRPDPCDRCADIGFGDDGYAAESPLQSTAQVVDGSLWLSVTTTGFGDDNASIIALLEIIHRNATG